MTKDDHDDGAMMKLVILEIAVMTWMVTEDYIINLPWNQTPIFFSVLSAASINIPGSVLLFNNCLLNEQKHE